MPFGMCNASATFQRCMRALFSDLIESALEVFMDDFSLFGESFQECLDNLELVLVRCQESNLVLNWEKCHFMVKEEIVLAHRISKKGLEVDQAKVEVIEKLPPPTNIKDCLKAFETLKTALATTPIIIAPDLRRDRVFHSIYYASKTLNEAQLNYTTTEKELLDVVFAFDNHEARHQIPMCRIVLS
ncbi:reverse transcriptase-like protein [Trifolium medium]|uniref:Reverse transcriptase-like protein n=1 Tax=Trifolium medium TaxID=97028 RepID=A0A392MFU4_9FABA|nr:reverse transcriptase-like protein [Trifolium medium]